MMRIFAISILWISYATAQVPYSSTLTSCTDTTAISLTLSKTPVAGSGQVNIQIPGISNNNGASSGICAATFQPSGSNSLAVSYTNSVISIPQNLAIIGTAACASSGTGSKGTNSLCVYGTDTNLLTQFNFPFNTAQSVLSNVSVMVGGGRVTISFSDSNTSNASGYKICFGTSSDSVKDGGGDCRDFSGTSNNVIKDLINGTDYWFAAKSASGTQWLYFGPYKPIESFGFTEVYDGAENPVSWNCAQSNVPPVGGLLLLMVLVWLYVGLPRRLRLLAMTMLMTSAAFADLGQVNLGFLGTPYRPALDLSTKPDGSRISAPFYKCMYEDKLSPLLGFEVDVHLMDDFGSLQLGIGTQYTFVNGKALLSKDGCDRSNDSVRLHMLHLRPQLTYILDPWVDYFPLVPYLRVGLVGVGYIFQYQDGWDQENKGGPGKNMGMVFGWSAAAGLMLSMKFLEPGSAARAVSNGVYDNIYLKAEAAYMPVNNFYKEGLNFSPSWPSTSTSFPIFLNFGLVFEFK